MKNRTAGVHIKAEEKRQKVLELRLAGYSIRAIARVLGVAPSLVHRYLLQVLERVKVDPEQVELYRRLELERLDRATRLVMERIEEGDLAAVDRLVRIIDLRMRILGAYNAQPVDARTPIQLVWPDGRPVDA